VDTALVTGGKNGDVWRASSKQPMSGALAGTMEAGRWSVGGFANSPREEVDLVLDYRDRVW